MKKNKQLSSDEIYNAIIAIARDNDCYADHFESRFFIRVPYEFRVMLECEPDYIPNDTGIGESDALLGNMPIVFSDKAYAIEYKEFID